MASAAAELQGIRYLRRTQAVLRNLLDYRAAEVKALIRPEMTAHSASSNARISDDAITSINASIARIADRPLASTPLDEAIAVQLDTFRTQWLSTSRRADATPADISATIASIQPLLTVIGRVSGISNDPSMAGLSFGMAIAHFQMSLDFGTEAACTAEVNVMAHDTGPTQRFAVARLLAQAQTAIDDGAQISENALAPDLIAPELLTSLTSRNVRDFAVLNDRVTEAYVETNGPSARWLGDETLAGEAQRFTASSFALLNTLSEDVSIVTLARLDRAQHERRDVLWRIDAGVSLELLVLAVLGWAILASYQSQRKRMDAELALERSTLAAKLKQAEAQQELLRAKARFRALFDRATTGMIILDRQCTILDCNEAGRAVLEALDGPDGTRDLIVQHAPMIEELFAGRSAMYTEEHEYLDKELRSRWFHLLISPAFDDSAELFAVMMIRDITDAKSMEARLIFEAEHDALTGLPNRKRFLTVLQAALDDRKAGSPSEAFAVLFIDYNDFKTINDSFGHPAGDAFLVDEAARLRDSVRSTDFVARMGGDEFALILHGADQADIETGVTRLQNVLAVPVNIEGQLVTSSASFGIAQAESSYTLAAQMIRDADTAMYRAKALGSRNYVVFDAAMREQVVRRMQLSIGIAHALDSAELELFYQPIVDLRDGKIAGCEALVRWRRADGSLVSPDQFIPLAEENGAVIEIGRWVVATACEQMAKWNELARTGGLTGLRDGFKIHVNLAVPEVLHRELLPNLRRILAQTRVSRDRIVLEITEGVVLKNTPQVRSILESLTEDGFRLCIDDFGTGYSSLRYLNNMPLSYLKIDRSFVSDGGEGLANTPIVEMLLVLSRALAIEVVAEGIETRKQWEALRDLGCRYAQGYLFSVPVEAGAFTAMLRADVAVLAATPPAFRKALAPA